MTDVERLLDAVAKGDVGPAEAAQRLRSLAYEDLGHSRIDHDRELRVGIPEVVFGQGKTSVQIVDALACIFERSGRAMATRLGPDVASDVIAGLGLRPHRYHEGARVLVVGDGPPVADGGPPVAVVSAGTADWQVVEEAAVCAAELGNEVRRFVDVGVAGLHRLLAVRGELSQCGVIIVVAGMEGALASVVGGLFDRPVIAVPTSVGYGAAFGGLAALLGMMTSCAAGVTVVNIDNGFGAAYAATLINRRRTP